MTLGAWSWRGCRLYVVLLAITSLVAAGWIYRYWSRGGRSYAGDTLPRLTDRLPPAIRDNVSRRGLAGAVEAPAMALWAFGPIALPIVAAGCGAAYLFLRRRRRWALAATLVAALAALPVIYGGAGALRGLEGRHYYPKSPYVRTYRYLAAPLVVASMALLALVTVDGLVLARRRARTLAEAAPTPTNGGPG